MKKTRTTRELLILMREYIKFDGDFYGLCGVIFDLNNEDKITDREYYCLNNYLDDNKMSTDKQWGNTEKGILQFQGGFWWKMSNKAPRLRWLNKHIDKLKLQS